MLHHRKAPGTSLEEDFKALGLPVDEDSIHAQATLTIEEAVVGIGVKGHGGDQLTEEDDGEGGGGVVTEDTDDPIDGSLVTRELLARIVNLPFEQMEATDFDSILEELKKKELPDGDEELEALAAEVVEQLVEARVQRIRKAGGGFAKKAKAGFHKVGGQIQRIQTGERIMKARKRKKYMRGVGKVKSKRWARTVGKRHAKRLAMRAPIGGTESELAMDLESLVSESIVGDKYAPIMDRLASIFSLIDEQLCDDQVASVLERTWTNFSKQITEDTDEDSFMESMKPVLVVVKRCLEEFERVDESDASEGGKEAPKGARNRGKKTVQQVSGQDAGTGHTWEDDEPEDDDQGND